jgi:hypothetical protein
VCIAYCNRFLDDAPENYRIEFGALKKEDEGGWDFIREQIEDPRD